MTNKLIGLKTYTTITSTPYILPKEFIGLIFCQLSQFSKLRIKRKARFTIRLNKHTAVLIGLPIGKGTQ